MAVEDKKANQGAVATEVVETVEVADTDSATPDAQGREERLQKTSAVIASLANVTAAIESNPEIVDGLL